MQGRMYTAQLLGEVVHSGEARPGFPGSMSGMQWSRGSHCAATPPGTSRVLAALTVHNVVDGAVKHLGGLLGQARARRGLKWHPERMRREVASLTSQRACAM